MYCKWCKRSGFKAEISYISESQKGWFKVEFVVTGKGVYEKFLPEAGGHRIQRIPPTEKRGRRHTSTITVAVLPIIENNTHINQKDLDWSTFKSSGPGGQHVNKVETAVRLKHKPTGIVVSCQSGRSQKRNKELAYKLLCSKIYAEDLKKSLDKDNAARKKQIGSGQRGDKIRTYRFQDDIVVDHKTGRKRNLSDIIAGNLDVLR
jgi:peptide chain release factor 1